MATILPIDSRAAVITLVMTSAAAAIPQDRPAFRSGTDIVAIYATVHRNDGRLVPNLTRDDFRLFDDGQPAEITLFSNAVVPITAVVMLDMSNSMATSATFVANAAEALVGALSPDDRLAIGTFGAEVAVSPLLTSDKNVLNRILRDELWPGGGTPLWSALRAAMNRLSAEPGRRAVITLSDGGDACPATGYNGVPPQSLALGGRSRPSRVLGTHLCATPEAIDAQATAGEFVVYAIELNGFPKAAAPSVSGLRRLAERTGGGHVLLDRRSDLRAAFIQVVDELRHQYLIGFRPSALDGKRHRLRVKTSDPGFTVRTRESYVALSVK